jgi:hypothetical protein
MPPCGLRNWKWSSQFPAVSFQENSRTLPPSKSRIRRLILRCASRIPGHTDNAMREI